VADLQAYLDRIGFKGEARPDRATLDEVHRRHLLSISYENLDVQLGRPLATDPQAALDKVADRRRGGWCYEMNGSLGRALGLIGFKVTRMAGGVGRSATGDAAVGNHLVLRVDDLPGGPLIADVGFGDGPMTPFPLQAHAFQSKGFDYRLEDLGEGWWRMHNHPRGGAPNFDFRAEAADEAVLAARCQSLQTDPASIFVQNLFCFRHNEDGYAVLRGRVLKRVTPAGAEDYTIASPGELLYVLREVFDLDVPEIATRWPAILKRHEEVVAASS
jgi:N-hydroxyarylamine O-acetyltransferase